MLNKLKKIRVLHIITNLPIGGAQDNTLITVEKLNKEHYDVSLMSASDGGWMQRALKLKNVKLFFVDELVRRIHLLYDVIALIKIYQIIKRRKYDIVHTHSSKPGFSGRLAAKIAKVPIIIHTIHGFPFNDFMNPVIRKFFILLERWLSKFSDILITVSFLNQRKAIDLQIAKPEKFVNIYSGICFEKFDIKVDIKTKRKELGIANHEKVVGMVGRLSAAKSPQYFIQAIPEVLQLFPHTKFLLIGDGELRKEVEKLIKKLNLDKQVSILGFRDDVPELLHILDIFVLSSCWEGLGRSLTEAMYLSRPVVATSVEGVPELVINDETGILVPPKDAKSISQAIIHLLQNPEKAKKLGENARKNVLQDFSADKMVDEIDKLYQRIGISKNYRT